MTARTTGAALGAALALPPAACAAADRTVSADHHRVDTLLAVDPFDAEETS